MSLDGLWDFLPECDRVPKGIPLSFPRKLEVPSVWESLPDLRAYRGVGWYRTSFELEKAANVRLRFGGVSHTAAVWIDGAELGGHYDAFTPWDLVATGLKAGEHQVVVRVDNTFGDHSALHIPNDYYTYGGISRPVELQIVPDLYIDQLLARPRLRRGKWDLELRVRLRNVGAGPASGTLLLEVAGAELDATVPETSAGERVQVAETVKDLDVEPWSETSPTLYAVSAELLRDGAATDDRIDRVGFRDVKVKGEKLLLNGGELRLRGFNRHEDHPTFGCALPTAMLAHDLDLFNDLNANFLRTCHYPNDMRLLDMCDERGVYVWEESHSRQTPFDHPKFDEQIETSTTEMVENHFNHPCIVTWGSLNECDTESDRGIGTHERLMNLLRELDDSRPVTYAGNRMKRDKCAEYADIVSWNIYTGWYGGGQEDIGPFFEDMLAWLDSDASEGGSGKPVILSEFGGGAIPGCRNVQADYWSEDYQAKVLDEALKVYLHHSRIVGAAIWQFCDVRVSRESNPHNRYNPMGRPRTMNNKGVVDEFRRPKLSCSTVRSHFAAVAKKRGRL